MDEEQGIHRHGTGSRTNDPPHLFPGKAFFPPVTRFKAKPVYEHFKSRYPIVPTPSMRQDCFVSEIGCIRVFFGTEGGS